MCLKRFFRSGKLKSEISKKQKVLRGLISGDEKLQRESELSEELLTFNVYYDENKYLVTRETSQKLSQGIAKVEEAIATRWQDAQNQEGYLARQLVSRLISASLLTEYDRGHQTNQVIYHQLLPGISLGYNKNIQSVISLIMVTKALEDWLGKISEKAAKQIEKDPSALLEPLLTEVLTKKRNDALELMGGSGRTLTNATRLTSLAIELIPRIFDKQGWTKNPSGLTVDDLFGTKEKPAGETTTENVGAKNADVASSSSLAAKKPTTAVQTEG